jgi:hypothetical protein
MSAPTGRDYIKFDDGDFLVREKGPPKKKKKKKKKKCIKICPEHRNFSTVGHKYRH